MVDFHGWSMPINYGSQIEEHHAVRHKCGIFDVSHMTILDFEGEESEVFIRKLIANDVKKLKEKYSGLYSAMLNDNGYVIDDLIAYRMDEGFRLVVNCATRGEDLKWISSKAKDYKVKMLERDDLSMVAIQGPGSVEVLKKFPTPIDYLENKKRQQGTFKDNIFAAKTGYTGELGFEVILPNEQAIDLWNKAVTEGAQPIGLAARDTLRLEAGMNLYGLEMDETISPFECNMGWSVSWEDEDRDFFGKNGLLKQKESNDLKELVGIITNEKAILRQGQKIHLENENHARGVVTSGTYSPTLKKPIALVRMPKTNSKSCYAEIRGKKIEATIGSPKFIKEGQTIFKERA